MAKFNLGDKAFIIESSIFVNEIVIVRTAGGFVTIRYPNSNGGFRVRESRLFATKQEAEANIRK